MVLSEWSIADFMQACYLCLTALSIVVTAFVGIWVVNTVQKNINKESTLKDHFAKELITLRSDARLLIEKFTSDQLNAEEIKRTHYSIQVRMKDLLNLLNGKYGIDKQYLKAYRSNIPKILEEDASYKGGFGNDNKVKLSTDTKQKLYTLSRDNDHVFNEILLKIYG